MPAISQSVDDADLLQVLFAFGGADGAADVNSDGIVDDVDLLICCSSLETAADRQIKIENLSNTDREFK